ncbi:glutathione S-transferase family protein [Mangrovibacter phragmitis]|uniref:glutathione S-transferase family protein n=1 Tax=Mangrovibacter phragmitis TaxID=1691903 RepID=UPI00336A9BA0
MIKVWGRNNSTNVKKVLWCLEELGLEYENIPAGGQFGKTHDPEYLAMNPNALIPCLQDDTTGITLWESNVIVRYLAAQYGQQSLWTENPAKRAQGEKWMDWAASTLPYAFRGVYLGLVRTPPEQRDEQSIKQSRKECEKLLTMLDQALAQSEWLSGEEFGIADIAPAPIVYGLLNLDITWPEWPHLRNWYQRLSQRPAFRRIVMIPLS